MTTINTHAELIAFYGGEVKLPEDKRKEMKERRKTNRKRLNNGLIKNKMPTPKHHLIQGSFAMYTMVQRPNDDYDIDDGACFSRDDLKGAQGADKTALTARQMVRDAIDDDSYRFNKKPECLPKCVRVHYATGYHVDIPVYREWTDDDGTEHRELAAADWIESDPQIITNWFKKVVPEKSPEDNQPYQMRRLVCLLKAWASSRESWNLPSGLIFSVLVDELYVPQRDRDDIAFHALLKTIKARLDRGDKTAQHPDPETDENFASGREAKMDSLQAKLDEWLPKLEILDDPDCTKKQALDAWNKFFNTHYFDQYIEDEDNPENRNCFVAMGGIPKKAVDKGGDTTFG